MSTENHEMRELRFRQRIANKVMGKQGDTIARLRGELARVRAEGSKIERGDLRRLERFEEMALEQFRLDKERLERAHEKIRELMDTVEKQITEIELLESQRDDLLAQTPVTDARA